MPIINPTAPTNIAISNPFAAWVSIEFSGAVAGSSPIFGYRISFSTFDGATWSTPTELQFLETNEAWGSVSTQIPAVSTTAIKVLIRAEDVDGGVSDYAPSNVIGVRFPPVAPTIIAPKMNAKIYSSTPKYLIEVAENPYGEPQTINVLASDGVWYNSTDNAEMFNFNGEQAIFANPHTNFGSVIAEFRVDDSTTGSAVGVIFQRIEGEFEPIIADTTHVKASQILALLSAIGEVRGYYNMPPFSWEFSCEAGVTNVAFWTYHIRDLRAAIDGVIAKINGFSDTEIVPPIDWISLGTGRPRADVMEQLKNVILIL